MNDMENRIEHFTEPNRLYLAWQAPDHLGDRHRWAVGLLERGDDGHSLRYFEVGPEFESLNEGRRFEELQRLGFQGYLAFPLDQSIHDKGVLETFMRRLPPRSRADFGDYMRQFRLAGDAEISDFALLGYTGAKLPSDGFSIVDPLDQRVQSCDVFLEVAGYRYQGFQPALDDPIHLRAEPDNPHDPGAVAVHHAGGRIGYINRLKAPTFRGWLSSREISGVIERLNGDHERPRAFVFLRVRPAENQAAA